MDRYTEDKGHLIDIMRSIEEINGYLGDASFEDFSSRENMRQQVYYMLQTIGGASRLLSDEFKDKYRDVDWDVLYNLSFAAYNIEGEIEASPVWYIIKEDLSMLHDQVSDLVTVLEDKDDDFMY
ncbi:MAG: DUF86 domain-containing protein [Cytophagaceae bacterium]